MPVRAAITEAGLRRAMRDPRYLRSWHPERTAFADWVGEGFRMLETPAGRESGVVFVRAYTRVVDGKPVHVAAHSRSGRPSGGGGVVLAQAPFLLTPRAPLLYSRPPVGPRVPMERIPRQSGKEAASDTPSWARGWPRYVGEHPRQYAERLLDRHHGGRQNWDRRPSDRGQDSEFSQIMKYGARAFRNPPQRVLGGDLGA